MGSEQAGDRKPDVLPLEHTAFFDIETDDGYVRIDQSVGNQVLYTPAEARDIADSIREAAEDAAGSDP
jgi:hypothetical protein